MRMISRSKDSDKMYTLFSLKSYFIHWIKIFKEFSFKIKDFLKSFFNIFSFFNTLGYKRCPHMYPSLNSYDIHYGPVQTCSSLFIANYSFPFLVFFTALINLQGWLFLQWYAPLSSFDFSASFLTLLLI
jgi:hypothetical protein